MKILFYGLLIIITLVYWFKVFRGVSPESLLVSDKFHLVKNSLNMSNKKEILNATKNEVKTENSSWETIKQYKSGFFPIEDNNFRSAGMPPSEEYEVQLSIIAQMNNIEETMRKLTGSESGFDPNQNHIEIQEMPPDHSLSSKKVLNIPVLEVTDIEIKDVYIGIAQTNRLDNKNEADKDIVYDHGALYLDTK